MNSIVALPIAVATPTIAPTLPSAGSDEAIVAAANALFRTDEAIDQFLKRHGDKADEMQDRWDLEDKRNQFIAVLIETPAQTPNGIQAKAAVLRDARMIEDTDQHQQISVSLADDLIGREVECGSCEAGQEPATALDTYRKENADLLDLRWEPWTDDPQPDTKPFLTNTKLQRMIGIPGRLAYAYMFRSREEQIEHHRTEPGEEFDELQAIWKKAEGDLDSLKGMICGARIRHLASLAAYGERQLAGDD